MYTHIHIFIALRIYFRNIVEPNIQNEQYITGLIGSLIQELETKINNIHNGDLFLMKLKLQEAVKLFRVSIVYIFSRRVLYLFVNSFIS